MLIEDLPGRNSSYLMRAGNGLRYKFANCLATTVARPADTGGLFDATYLSGGAGDVLPSHQHLTAHKIYYVFDGRISLSVNGAPRLLTRGDFVSIPQGTVHDLRFLTHRSRVLEMAFGGDAAGLYPIIGEKSEFYNHAPIPAASISDDKLRRASESLGLTFSGGVELNGATAELEQFLPNGVSPYGLGAGNGVRLVAADQIYTMLSLRKNTTKDFFSVVCEGPIGKRIPEHFHERHSEVFVCVDGRVSMTADGKEVVLYPGDFLQVAAGTRHTYKLEDHYTRFFSILTPGLFEPFFFTIGEPWEPLMFPETPGPLRIDRVMQNLSSLDVKFTGAAGVGMRTAGWFLRRFRR
jgi:quercetin 2,3-dioxygenase